MLNEKRTQARAQNEIKNLQQNEIKNVETILKF